MTTTELIRDYLAAPFLAVLMVAGLWTWLYDRWGR